MKRARQLQSRLDAVLRDARELRERLEAAGDLRVLGARRSRREHP